MAIVQISQITNRQGLTEDLPQLAGAEFGWCVDSRRLFIGNGTLQEGAPVIGNTEILTQFSDITATATYTYKDSVVGYTAQTGPTVGDPVIRTVQEKLDDFADVRDFGATGNGITDDWDAINRALIQLYCIENNPMTRRTLYFPAGTYLISNTLIIPTWAKLVGEGADCTIIQLTDSAPYVARYGDSLRQTGVNIGNGGAVAPKHIEISSMSFVSAVDTDVFLVEDAEQCWFDSVDFIGPKVANDFIIAPGTSIGVSFSSTSGYVCNNITFDKCKVQGVSFGLVADDEIQSITVSNSVFDTLYQGILLGTGAVVNGGPTGFRAVHNFFDNIYDEGVIYDNVNLNITAYNLFYNVGNEFTGNPQVPVIRFGNDNNASFNDLFARSNDDAMVEPRVSITGSTASTLSDWGTATSTQLQLGRYTRTTGLTFDLDVTPTPTAMFTVSSLLTKAFKVDYTIVQGEYIRTGQLLVTAQISGGSASTLTYSDDYNENYNLGIDLSVAQSVNTITVYYTNSGASSTITYSIAHLA